MRGSIYMLGISLVGVFALCMDWTPPVGREDLHCWCLTHSSCLIGSEQKNCSWKHSGWRVICQHCSDGKPISLHQDPCSISCLIGYEQEKKSFFMELVNKASIWPRSRRADKLQAQVVLNKKKVCHGTSQEVFCQHQATHCTEGCSCLLDCEQEKLVFSFKNGTFSGRQLPRTCASAHAILISGYQKSWSFLEVLSKTSVSQHGEEGSWCKTQPG